MILVEPRNDIYPWRATSWKKAGDIRFRPVRKRDNYLVDEYFLPVHAR